MSLTPQEETIFSALYPHSNFNVDTEVLDNIPGSNRKTTSRILRILHKPWKSAISTQSASVFYKLANWAGLNAARRSLDWPDIPLSSYSQEDADTKYAILHLVSKTSLLTHSTPTNAKKKIRKCEKILKQQNIYKLTLEFSMYTEKKPTSKRPTCCIRESAL